MLLNQTLITPPFVPIVLTSLLNGGVVILSSMNNLLFSFCVHLTVTLKSGKLTRSEAETASKQPAKYGSRKPTSSMNPEIIYYK